MRVSLIQLLLLSSLIFFIFGLIQNICPIQYDFLKKSKSAQNRNERLTTNLLWQILQT